MTSTHNVTLTCFTVHLQQAFKFQLTKTKKTSTRGNSL